MVVKIGCCGFARSRKKYYETFKLVELQNTFYDLPSVEWAASMRKEAPADFEFAVKAWQVISHPPSSPTWKKMKKKPPGEPSSYGLLKPTKENLEALEKTIEVARALGSNVVVIQTPASLAYNEDSARWISEFFSEAVKIAGPIKLGWEPRGDWAEAPELKKILEDNKIVHVVDPFRREPRAESGPLYYFRLHGIGKGEVNYKYKYTDEDLAKLEAVVKKYAKKGDVYVLFNNVYMFDDALRFKSLMSAHAELEVA